MKETYDDNAAAAAAAAVRARAKRSSRPVWATAALLLPRCSFVWIAALLVRL